jgi:hypothetical protein
MAIWEDTEDQDRDLLDAFDGQNGTGGHVVGTLWARTRTMLMSANSLRNEKPRGGGALVSIAGAGFEPATFGL